MVGRIDISAVFFLKEALVSGNIQFGEFYVWLLLLYITTTIHYQYYYYYYYYHHYYYHQS